MNVSIVAMSVIMSVGTWVGDISTAKFFPWDTAGIFVRVEKRGIIKVNAALVHEVSRRVRGILWECYRLVESVSKFQ